MANKEKLVIGSSETSVLWSFLGLFMCFEIKGLSGEMGFSVHDSIQHSWRRWLCSWTSSIPKYHSSLIWRTRDTWITKSSPLTSQAAIWCDGTGTSETCSLTIPPVFLGSTGSSAWQRRGKHPACRELSRARQLLTGTQIHPCCPLQPTYPTMYCRGLGQSSGAW